MGRLNGRKIEAMGARYGWDPENRSCADCRHCVLTVPGARRYWKCELYGVTAGESTDWVKRWPACGMINRESGEIPVIEQLKHAPRPRPQQISDGQISITEVIA